MMFVHERDQQKDVRKIVRGAEDEEGAEKDIHVLLSILEVKYRLRRGAAPLSP